VKNYFYFTRELEGAEPAPIENGNMMLLESYEPTRLDPTAAKWIISAVPIQSPWLKLRWQGEGVHLYEMANAGRLLPDPTVMYTELADATLIGESLNSLVIIVGQDQEMYWLLRDTYYPGWRAFIDQQPAEIELYRGVFRQIKVPPGEHRVFMAYYPATVICGLFISLIALAILVAILMPRGVKNVA